MRQSAIKMKKALELIISKTEMIKDELIISDLRNIASQGLTQIKKTTISRDEIKDIHKKHKIIKTQKEI